FPALASTKPSRDDTGRGFRCRLARKRGRDSRWDGNPPPGKPRGRLPRCGEGGAGRVVERSPQPGYGMLSPGDCAVPKMKSWADAVSSLVSSPTPAHWLFVPKLVTAIIVFVPARKSGPPESPKHWAPLPCDVLPEILTSSPCFPLPTLSRFADAPSLVKAASGCFLQFGSHGSGFPKCWTPYPVMSTSVPVRSPSSKPSGGKVASPRFCA